MVPLPVFLLISLKQIETQKPEPLKNENNFLHSMRERYPSLVTDFSK